jgi:hypothetical protein
MLEPHVFSGGQRKVLQQYWHCFIDEHIVCHGGKASREEIWTNDTIS